MYFFFLFLPLIYAFETIIHVCFPVDPFHLNFLLSFPSPSYHLYHSPLTFAFLLRYSIYPILGEPTVDSRFSFQATVIFFLRGHVPPHCTWEHVPMQGGLTDSSSSPRPSSESSSAEKPHYTIHNNLIYQYFFAQKKNRNIETQNLFYLL